MVLGEYSIALAEGEILSVKIAFCTVILKAKTCDFLAFSERGLLAF